MTYNRALIMKRANIINRERKLGKSEALRIAWVEARIYAIRMDLKAL